MTPAQEYLQGCFYESQAIKDDFYKKNADRMIAIADLMGMTFARGNKIIVMGNGGSASDALHFSGELTGRLMHERRPLPCIVLGSGMASLTAIANDYSYDMAFKREMKAFAKPGDMVFAISTSGKSKNVCHAAAWAKESDCYVVSLTGASGGLLCKIAHIDLNVGEAKNSARCQEVHIWIIHCLIDLMDQFFLKGENLPAGHA